jgi:two-component system sensor histidine kinase GlrK
MRPTIFWRIVLVQTLLISLILAISLYAHSQLKELTILSTNILTTDSTCIEEEKRLLRIFLAQMRHAEKYLLLRDKEFYDAFILGDAEFEETMAKIVTWLDAPQERAWIEQTQVLYGRYSTGMKTALTRLQAWNREKTELSEGIAASINDLIRFREDTVARKTAATRDRAMLAAGMITWLTMGGISTAVLLTYFHASGVSRPLKKLTHELLRVGKGEFQRSLDIRGPKEVKELSQAFNWMAARLAELDQMKADFIAHVSHELRTPLTGIQEGTALLLENTPDPITLPQREILEVVQSHGDRLGQWIAAILDLSKMEAGMMEYLPLPCNFSQLLDKSTQSIQLVAQKKAITLEIVQSPALPSLVVDESRIQQVLNNLLSNAVKFTPAHGLISITAALRHEPGSQQWLECRVSDTGIGIPPEESERIFDRFYQSPYHRQHGQQGTGLGLAIARYIVEAHGGKIWVESRIGAGATFIFILPVNRKETRAPHLLT